jgi:CRP/FNR family transcriptional regulator
MKKVLTFPARQTDEDSCPAVQCRDCSFYRLGLAPGQSLADPRLLEKIARNHRTLKRGDYLYRLGEPVHAIYAIRFGSFKSYVLTQDGRMQITGFKVAGEAMGLADLATGKHSTEAQALEPASLCEIPLAHLDHLSRILPSFSRQLQGILSSEIHHYQCLALVLGRKSAEERLATFLLDLSARYHARGFSALSFNLSMSRGEIGTYLGIAEETVCRLFTRFQDDGLIEAKRRLVRILSPDRMRALAQG